MDVFIYFELIELVKSKTEFKTDYAISKELKVTRQKISLIKNQGHHLNENDILKLSEMLKENPFGILSSIFLSINNKLENKNKWRDIAKKSLNAETLYIM